MKKQKAMNLYWQGMYFRYGSLCESFLRKRLAVPKVLQTNGFGTYFCICRKIMVQPCAWMKWQRTSGSAEASAAAILRNMPGKPFLLQYRIDESMYLLTETDRTIAQIAQDCGFSQQSYYAKKFREQTGMTPGQYRERMKANLS